MPGDVAQCSAGSACLTRVYRVPSLTQHKSGLVMLPVNSSNREVEAAGSAVKTTLVGEFEASLGYTTLSGAAVGPDQFPALSLSRPAKLLREAPASHPRPPRPLDAGPLNLPFLSRLDLGIAAKARAAEERAARQDPGAAGACGTALGAAPRVCLNRGELSLPRLRSAQGPEGHFSAQVPDPSSPSGPSNPGGFRVLSTPPRPTGTGSSLWLC